MLHLDYSCFELCAWHLWENIQNSFVIFAECHPRLFCCQHHKL